MWIIRIVGFGMTTVAQLIYCPLGRMWFDKPRNSGTWPSSTGDRCPQIPKKLKNRCNATFLFEKTQVKWATQYSTHSQFPFHLKRSKNILLDTRVMSLGLLWGQAYQDKGPCEARAKQWAWFQWIPWPRALPSLKTHSNLGKNWNSIYKQTLIMVHSHLMLSQC